MSEIEMESESNQRREADEENPEQDEMILPEEDEEPSSAALAHPPPAPLPVHETNIPSLCCALLASITTGGTTYAFGLYGNTLKKTLHLTQPQLDTISTANFCAGLLSWAPGMLVDRLGTRFGITLGGLTGATSLMLFWMVSTTRIEIADSSILVSILSMLGVLTFLSCALITGSVFKIISISCGPGSKGSAVGAAKGYVGLGSGCFACIFESLQLGSDLNFLPMAAFFFLVCAVIPSWLILPGKAHESDSKDVLTPLHFHILFASLAILAFVIVETSLSQLRQEDHADTADEDGPNYKQTALLVWAWISPIVVQVWLPQKPHVSYSVVAGGESDSLLQSDEAYPPVDQEQNCAAADEADPIVDCQGDQAAQLMNDTEGNISVMSTSRDKNLFEMLQTVPAMLMLWTTTILVGAGTVETNQLGQMVESLGFKPGVTSAGLALFSVAQSAGRVTFGAISESAMNSSTSGCCIDKGIPRPFFLVLASILGVTAHSVLAVATTEAMFVFGIFLSGLAFGSVWPLLVLIVGEIFGTAHVAANYMFYDGFTSAAGTLLLSKVIAQDIYEDHIVPGDGDDVTCFGQACFKTTHTIIALLSVTCIITSATMQYNTRGIYNKGFNNQSG